MDSGPSAAPGLRLPIVDMTLQDPLVGRVVDGRYLVESRIARGGMATVYLALDRRLDREVALKVMHDNLAIDDEFVSRFVREARAAARLSHPNVVQVFDQGSDGPVLYLAMEYLPGRTLRDVLSERGALTPRESVSVLEPVLGALAAAHRAGIVHGDVKPENVILTDDGRIKVADFGLARAITAPITATATGELLGTVAYLAPELVSRGIADARADVYAAGIMLFELFTGKQPFTGSDPLQVAYRHVHETVPPPTSLSPELPLAFDRVVLEATSHDPDLRPHDAGALLTDLHAAQDRVPDGQLDVRAADAATLRLDATATALLGAPAAAGAPQPTRALAVSRRANRTSGQMVPRLRVHDDEPAPPGFLGDRNRQAIAAIAGAVVLVLVICTGIWWFTGGPGSYTDTPAVTGERLADAQRILAAQGLHSQPKQAFSTTVAAGQVISSDPPAGKQVKKAGLVVLTVSKGPQLIPVPDVSGKSAADATAAITSAGLTLASTTKRFSSTVDLGKVISTSPKSGTRIAPDRPVALVVSKGIEQVALDNVINQNVDAATQLLQSHGFKVTTTMQPFVDPGPAAGTVTAQNPQVQQPGQTAPKGSTVTLTVIAQPVAPTQIPVPNVVGQNFDQAKQQLQQAGFQVTRQGGGFFARTVIAQSVNGQAPPGTNIVLTVG
jgi:eukaryotic-like serine/threonine-protein kinase